MPKILLIEDDEELWRLTEIILENRFELITASNGRDGIQIAVEAKPDLILLDINMDGLSGYEVCRILKENGSTASIPVVLFTAGAQQHEILKGYESGADDYIEKPFETLDFIRKIERLIPH